MKFRKTLVENFDDFDDFYDDNEICYSVVLCTTDLTCDIHTYSRDVDADSEIDELKAMSDEELQNNGILGYMKIDCDNVHDMYITQTSDSELYEKILNVLETQEDYTDGDENHTMKADLAEDYGDDEIYECCFNLEEAIDTIRDISIGRLISDLEVAVGDAKPKLHDSIDWDEYDEDDLNDLLAKLDKLLKLVRKNTINESKDHNSKLTESPNTGIYDKLMNSLNQLLPNEMDEKLDEEKNKQKVNVNTNAGDVEQGIAMFNRAAGSDTGTAEASGVTESVENNAESQLINIRSALNDIDKGLDKPCLVDLYDCVKLTNDDKMKIANMLVSDESNYQDIYEFLMTKLDGVDNK